MGTFMFCSADFADETCSATPTHRSTHVISVVGGATTPSNNLCGTLFSRAGAPGPLLKHAEQRNVENARWRPGPALTRAVARRIGRDVKKTYHAGDTNDRKYRRCRSLHNFRHPGCHQECRTLVPRGSAERSTRSAIRAVRPDNWRLRFHRFFQMWQQVGRWTARKLCGVEGPSALARTALRLGRWLQSKGRAISMGFYNIERQS